MLASRNIDVNRTVCASAYNDLIGTFIFVLVVPSGEAIECSATYDDSNDPESGPATSTDWHEAYRDWIAAGRALLDSEERLETGSQSSWIAHELMKLGQEVLVAKSRELRGIWGATRKHDRRDAVKLARYARMDPALLHPTRVRGPEAQRAYFVSSSALFERTMRIFTVPA